MIELSSTEVATLALVVVFMTMFAWFGTDTTGTTRLVTTVLTLIASALAGFTVFWLINR